MAPPTDVGDELRDEVPRDLIEEKGEPNSGAEAGDGDEDALAEDDAVEAEGGGADDLHDGVLAGPLYGG